MNKIQNYNVKVCCRFRPLNKNEINKCGNVTSPIDFLDDKSIKVFNPHRIDITDNSEIEKVISSDKKISFKFDKIFPPNSEQKEVYNFVGKPMIKELMDGYNCTLFTYGVTGSGKTYSMFGFDIESGETGLWKDEEGMGIIPRAINDVFQYISEIKDDVEVTIKFSFIEIYLEKVKDLLNPKKDNLKIRETKNDIYVEDLKEEYVSSFEEILVLLRKGQKNRATASTKMNQYSSRSHSLIMLKITQHNLTKHIKTSSKLFMIDLAGSERVSKSGAEGLTLEQVKHINTSLLELGNVIHSITEKEEHIPYRNSKLTRLLEDSLGGNSKTCLLLNCSPGWYTLPETVSSLHFGARAKKIENRPRINKELTVADYQKLIVELERRIKELEEIIKEKDRYIRGLRGSENKEGIKGELERGMEELKGVLKENNELKELLERSKEDLEKNREKIEDNNIEIDSFKGKITELEKICDDKNREILELTSSNHKSEIDKKKIEIEMFEKNTEISLLKSKMHDLNKLNDIIDNYKKKEIEYEKKIDKYESNKNKHFKETKDKSEELIRFEKENRKYKRDLEVLQERFTNTDSNLTDTIEKYSELSKENDNIRKNLMELMSENIKLQFENDNFDMKLKEIQLENTKSLEQILLKEKEQTDIGSELEKTKKSLQRKAEEVIRIKIQFEELENKFQSITTDNKNLERQIRRLRHKNINNDLNLSTGDLSDSNLNSKQFNSLRKNLKKMREYNFYIRGRERYYLSMIDNRGKHIETLEDSLKEASRILLRREQEYMSTIGALKNEIQHCYNMLKQLGVPENILGAKKDKIIVPIKNK